MNVHLFYFSFLRVTKGVCLGTRAHSCSTIHWLSACLREIRSLDFRFGVISFSWSVVFLHCFCFYLYLLLFRRTALHFFLRGFSATCSGVLPTFFLVPVSGFFLYLGFGDLCNLLTGIGEEIFFDWTFGFLLEGKRVPLDWADI